MKNVYFIQVGFAFDKSVYLPYATGTIVAYCKSRPEIAAEYDFKEIIFRRDDIDKIVDGMESPYIVAFSTYVWNVEFNKALAKAVKEAQHLPAEGGPRALGGLVVGGAHAGDDHADERAQYQRQQRDQQRVAQAGGDEFPAAALYEVQVELGLEALPPGLQSDPSQVMFCYSVRSNRKSNGKWTMEN